ncbi:hypothetical protein NIES22_06680 [Calothrix brevissima NIES-22]|nr:hypothetical protein NIES22_06680 [Calothrix brevissima NIES-22]
MNILADTGISSAVSAIGGRLWQDPYRFGQLINTAIQLRQYFSIISVVVVAPILFLMLLHNGASISYTLLLIAGILIELYFYLTIGVLIVVPRLQSQISQLQRLDLLFSGSRILLIIGGTLTFLNAAIAAFASTIASGLQNSMLRYFVKSSINIKASINQEYKFEILKIVKAQAPTNIFYCLQGQITVWLISIFGNTQNIAEVGALGRLGVIFSVVSSVMIGIILPSFSRCQSFKLLIKKYCQILFFYTILCLLILLISILFPEQILWILGTKYSHLKREVFYFILASLTQSITGMLWSINASKGWIEESWLFIPTIIGTQIVLLLFLDISNIIGITLFSMLSLIPASCINFYMTYKGLSQEITKERNKIYQKGLNIND